MLHIPALLDAAALDRVAAAIDGGDWIDGRATAGHMSARAKQNVQLGEESPQARAAGAIVLAALDAHPLFVSAALPALIVPPLFNRYEGGGHYGPHIDGAIRHANGRRIRTDLSATVFLSDPADYDGGELVVKEAGVEQRIKLPAGDMILYAGTGIHHVEPVTRGVRTAAFFWIQSLVRDDSRRQMLLDLDGAIQSLAGTVPDDPALLVLTGHYHNLIRLWADS